MVNPGRWEMSETFKVLPKGVSTFPFTCHSREAYHAQHAGATGGAVSLRCAGCSGHQRGTSTELGPENKEKSTQVHTNGLDPAAGKL